MREVPVARTQLWNGHLHVLILDILAAGDAIRNVEVDELGGQIYACRQSVNHLARDERLGPVRGEQRSIMARPSYSKQKPQKAMRAQRPIVHKWPSRHRFTAVGPLSFEIGAVRLVLSPSRFRRPKITRSTHIKEPRLTSIE